MTTIGDIFDSPTQVHQGDFVLRLTEGVTRPADTQSGLISRIRMALNRNEQPQTAPRRMISAQYRNGIFGSPEVLSNARPKQRPRSTSPSQRNGGMG